MPTYWFAHFPNEFFPPDFWFPDGHFPALNVQVAEFTLYPLFPLIERTRSLFASSLPDEGSNYTVQSILKRVTNALDLEYLETEGEIDGLETLMDPDNIDSAYFNYLVDYLGGTIESSWPTGTKRQMIRCIVALWLIKGTKGSVEVRLRHTGWDSYIPIELWKSIIYEIADYSRIYGYGNTLQSARIHVANATTLVSADPSDLKEMDEILQLVLPIHVRPINDFDETTFSLSDSLGTVAETFDFVINGTGVAESTPGFGDSLTVTLSCVTGCESFCQVGAEYTCETGCEDACETTCQTSGESDCQITCQFWCQVYCQTTCESSCQVVCEVNCEIGCEITCETSCEEQCEVLCQVAGEAWCVISCQLACQYGCESLNCETGVE